MKRLRVVLDTNVLISALLFDGPPRQILRMIIAGSIDCSLSPAILDELRDVLQRPKFGFSSRQAAAVVEELCSFCEIVDPVIRISVVKADPDDDRVIECAVQAKASVIVSGDAHLLGLGTHKGTRILSPADFLSTVVGGRITRRRRT
jgi:putative PIN family toxin of toxin-antitoxin system